MLPTLELKSRVAHSLILNYRKLVNSPESIPCSRAYANVGDIIKLSMLDKALFQRLENKAITVSVMLEKNNNDWEETAYQLLARNFGFKVNSEPFESLAKVLPLRILLKHADKLTQVEALFFGQAGFLDDNAGDDYFNLLKREYHVLGQKYALTENRLNKVQWRFLRMRPANFPTIRIAQLSTLIHREKNIFSRILDASTYQDVKRLFTVQQSEYWCHHYQFLKYNEHPIAGLGEMSVDNIIINTVAPLLVAYGKLRDEQEWIDRAASILQQVPAENNSIIKQWMLLDQPVKSAFDTQGLIEMYNHFCVKRRCLDCTIGSSLLKPVPA